MYENTFDKIFNQQIGMFDYFFFSFLYLSANGSFALLNDIVCSVIMILTDDVTKQPHYCCLLLSSFLVFDCIRCVNLFSLVLVRMSSPFTNIFFSVFFFIHPYDYLGTWKDHLEYLFLCSSRLLR
jgi:hypothetical protein